MHTNALQILQLGGVRGSHSSQFYETPSSYSLAGHTHKLNTVPTPEIFIVDC